MYDLDLDQNMRKKRKTGIEQHQSGAGGSVDRNHRRPNDSQKAPMSLPTDSPPLVLEPAPTGGLTNRGVGFREPLMGMSSAIIYGLMPVFPVSSWAPAWPRSAPLKGSPRRRTVP